jgi:hypothetical protein
MMEDGLMEHASEGNLGEGGGKEANSMISCNLGNAGRMVNLVVKVDVKENVGE